MFARRPLLESRSTESSSESPEVGGVASSAGPSRRAHIAAQACETCRTRKTRCDERRPRCGLCERLDLACVYREPRQTKRDKTAETILTTIQRIEGKLDRILQQDHPKNPERAQLLATLAESAKEINTQQEDFPMADISQQQDQRKQYRQQEKKRSQQQERCPSHLLDHDFRGALSVFPWPSVQALLRNADPNLAEELGEFLSEGSGWLVRHEMLTGIESMPPADTSLTKSIMHLVTSDGEQTRTVFPELTLELMDRYTHAYFGSFNMVYPVLDRQDFVDGILPTVRAHGFADGCFNSLIALLVFALGMQACEAEEGMPIADGSGICGGTAERPPALGIFNEARKRIGFVMGSSGVETAQAMLLTAIFYESCSRHIEFWRLTITAAEAIKAALRIGRDWDWHGTDMIRRVYWTCNVIESWYYFDLNLPRSDAASLQVHMALPDFDGRRDFEGEPSVEVKYQYNFLSMVSLRHLIHTIFEELHDYGATGNGRADGSKADQTLIIAELMRQLDEWRTILPSELGWTDDSRTTFDVDDAVGSGGDSTSIAGWLHVDILLAQLRCRYYYARFMIFQPYMWKALHEPDGLAATPVVLDGFVNAVDAMLEWSVAYPPVCEKKRLIPNIFVWTQSFAMFLLLLRVIRENEALWQICEDRVGRERIEESVTVMLDWVRDMRRVDGVAVWVWRTLRPLYGLED